MQQSSSQTYLKIKLIEKKCRNVKEFNNYPQLGATSSKENCRAILQAWVETSRLRLNYNINRGYASLHRIADSHFFCISSYQHNRSLSFYNPALSVFAFKSPHISSCWLGLPHKAAIPSCHPLVGFKN